MSTTAKADGHPYLAISIAFVAWKAGLVAIAVGSQVGPTYDTSSGLLIDPDQNTGRLLTRLTSWDAIYFVKAAQRGYLFEQEWAFGSALPWCISVLIQGKQVGNGPKCTTNERTNKQTNKQTKPVSAHARPGQAKPKLSFLRLL